jgi:hypothetical protein
MNRKMRRHPELAFSPFRRYYQPGACFDAFPPSPAGIGLELEQARGEFWDKTSPDDFATLDPVWDYVFG